MRLIIPIALLCAALQPHAALSREVNGQDPRPALSEPTNGEADTAAHAKHADDQNNGKREETELHFDPATQTVTIRMRVHGAGGTFVPDIRPDDFVVYENGVR